MFVLLVITPLFVTNTWSSEVGGSQESMVKVWSESCISLSGAVAPVRGTHFEYSQSQISALVRWSHIDDSLAL